VRQIPSLFAAGVTPRLQAVPARRVTAEREFGQEGFAVPAPSCSFRAYFTTAFPAAFMTMIFITA
jgi:hypothetical protein